MCCSNGDGTTQCRAVQNDPANCGGCGIACGAGVVCRSGVCGGAATDGSMPMGDCTPACSSAQRCCGTTCANRSVPAGTDGRTDSSFANCNGCGIGCDMMLASACSTPFGMSGAPSCVCGDFPQCAAGEVCVSTDTGSFQCVSTSTDPNNCGTIGNRCAEGEICSGGVCSCGGGATCTAGQSCCAGACISTTADPMNCGGCGMVCGSNAPDCNAGSCGCGTGPACAEPMPGGLMGGGSLGQSCCSGTCIANDTSNCGGCGVMCDADEDCIVASGGLPFPGLPMGMGVCCGMDIPIIGGFCGGGLPGGDGGGLPGLDAGLPFP